MYKRQVAAKTEADIAELETYEDRQMFLAEVGLEESGVARLIKSAYKLLNLCLLYTSTREPISDSNIFSERQ